METQLMPLKSLGHLDSFLPSYHRTTVQRKFNLLPIPPGTYHWRPNYEPTWYRRRKWRRYWCYLKKPRTSSFLSSYRWTTVQRKFNLLPIPLLPSGSRIMNRLDLGHRLRTPNLLGLGRQFWQINFGAFGVFSADLSAPILVLSVPCPCFPLINHYFYKKPSLYIQIPNIYLWLWFEFGPQRIRDLAIVCP